MEIRWDANMLHISPQVQETTGNKQYRLAVASSRAMHPAHPAYQSAALLQQLTAQGGNTPLDSRLQLETRGALSFPATSEPPGDNETDDVFSS
jgi:hypothetical protein